MSPAAPNPSVRDRIFGPTKREQYYEAQLESVSIVLGRIRDHQENMEIDSAAGDYSRVAENLADVELMLDAQNWTSIFDYDQNSGLTLRQVKEAARQLRELIVGNPFMQNGARVRTAAVWGGGVEFSGRNRTDGKVKKIPANIQTIMDGVSAQRYVFGNDAHEELERAAFTDGNFFLLGEDSTKRMQRIQLEEITADYRNPDNTEEIWAYRRAWYRGPQGGSIDPALATSSDSRYMVRWYYTDICPPQQKRQGGILYNGANEIAETGYTMLDKQFNRQVGWAYGVPDALAAIAWSRLYKDFLVNGYVMNRALARFAYKVTVSTAKGANNAATELTLPGQAGATAIEGQGNSLAPLATAGRGYDFGSGKPLAAAMAAGLGVSLLALLSDPSAATGSNAAAQTLDPIAKATAIMRRLGWDDWFVRLFRWLGLTQKLISTWGELSDETVQRILQAIVLVDQLEVLDGQHIQDLVAAALDIPDPGAIPAGWKPKSQRKAAPAASDSATGNTGGGDATGQGQNSPAGTAPNDHSTDQPAS